MPIEVKQFTGAIDTDSDNENIPLGAIRMAVNLEWYGPPGNLRPRTVLGTNLIPNIYLPNTGTNVTIGTYYDAVKHRLFLFNCNSAGNHGIYIYNTTGGTNPGIFQVLVANGATTNGDVLGFSPYVRIHSVGIIYGDPQDGDLLIFVDSLGRLRKANILRFLNGTYNTGGALIQSAYLDVIKAPPVPPIQAVYENDFTVAANQCVNSLFIFCCTYIYDDYEESVLGSGCKQPLPSDTFDTRNNVPTYRNARVGLYVPTGDQNVKKIRIYGKQVTGGATSDWFIVQDLIKADLGIADNTVYKYLFYNNGTYIAANPTFTVLDYDYVPNKLNTMEIINGNVISVAGCTEGYPFFNPTFQIATSNQAIQTYSLNGTLFFAATNGLFTSGQPQINIYLSGVGENNGFGNPYYLEKTPNILTVRAKSNGSDVSFTYTNSTARHQIVDIFTGLTAAATAAGWVVVSTSDNFFTAYYPTGTVVLQSAFIDGIAEDVSPNPSSVAAFFPQAAVGWGALHRDAAGRTNGVISNLTGNATTQAIGSAGQIPQFSIDLSAFQPPPWAAYWELVRTDNLTFNKYLHWITNAACQGTGIGVNTQYAYFGVSNIATYNASINATQGVVSYGFSPGDRIRIIARYDRNGVRYPLNFDYAILSEAVNPIANGTTQIGSYIQIYYPTGDVGGNFQFPISNIDTDFQNYEVVIYSYKAYATTNQNVYYQIGQQYGIGNPGTNTAYYMGNVADNKVVLTDGDVFYRKRTIPLQNTYFVPTGSYPQGTTYSTEWVNPGGNNSPIIDNGIWNITGDVHQNAGLGATQFPNYSNTGWDVMNESSEPFSVRLSGEQTIVDASDPNGQFAKYVKIVSPGNVVQVVQIIPLQTGLAPTISTKLEIDFTLQLPPGAKMWIINYAVNQINVGGYSLKIDIIRNITVDVFDASFSDIYSLKTNSDNKPNVINTQALTTYFSTLFRYSEAYQAGTNINNTNRFYPLNFDEFPKSWGDVMRMYAWGKRLRIFQQRRIGEVGVFSQFIVNQAGQVQLIKSDAIITPDNIQYFEFNGGIGNQPSSLISSGYQNYLPDPVTGKLLRVSLDGVKDISEEFMVQTFAAANVSNYLNNYAYQFGGNASLLGAYNVKQNKDAEILFVMQGGTGGPLGTIPGQTLSFNERKNAFSGTYSISPDAIVCCENQLYSCSNGNLYTHNNSTSYATFYGQFTAPSIQMVFNGQPALKKNFMAIGYQSSNNKVWAAINPGDVATSFVNPQSGRQQISQLPAANFSNEEGLQCAALKFDMNSGTNAQAAVNSGDPLLGWYLELTLTAPDNQFNFLYLPFLRFEFSPKTP